MAYKTPEERSRYMRKRRESPVFREAERLSRATGQRLAEVYSETTGHPGTHCDICGRAAPLCVDHCHTTGRVRGLICGQCNTGLGMLGDTPEALQRVLDYLKTKA